MCGNYQIINLTAGKIGMITKKTLFYKVAQVSSSTLLSRILGLLREVLMARYLGAGIFSDAFVTAFKIPNSLRKIFAEGALSAAMIPTFVEVMKREGKQQLNSLMTLSFLIVQSVLIALCALIYFKTDILMRFIVPGWYKLDPAFLSEGQSLDSFTSKACALFSSCIPAPQVAYAISYLHILIVLIIFLSCSALFAAALQAVHHFFVPAFSPVLLNGAFIAGILVCMHYGLPVEYLCFFIVCGGLIQVILHYVMYKKYGFGFGPITKEARERFKQIVIKFLPCLISMSVMEINLFIDTSIASFLPKGSTTLIYYADRFMGIPLGVFAIAFSTIMFPYFSRIKTYAPQRLQFFLFEAVKIILWIMIPIALVMGFFSYKIYYTLFLSDKFTLAQVVEASWILRAFLVGLCFASCNKILLNLYYALHETIVPLYVCVVASVTNFFLSYYVFMPYFGATGIALATTISYAVQTVIYLFFLKYKFGFSFFIPAFFEFLLRYCASLIAAIIPALLVYFGVMHLFAYAPVTISYYMFNTVLYWFWVGPIVLGMIILLYMLRKPFKVKSYFLEIV